MNSFERDDSADLEFPDLPSLGQMLSPPPSPLGDEFAKRTAALVLKRSNDSTRREVLRTTSTSKFASFGKDNPALTLFSRETARNTLKPLQAAAVFLLYTVPAIWLYEMPTLGVRPAATILSNAEIYFSFLFASLCFAVPLYLFTQTYAFYSRLIQGRAIEEILLTHIRPAELADSMLASSMRKVLPLIGLMTLSLLPTIYLDHHWSFFAWPIQSLVMCIFGCSLLQVYALRQGDGHSQAGLLGLLAGLVGLAVAQWFPLHALWTALVMIAVAFYCRRQSIVALTSLQQLTRSPQEFVEKKTAKVARPTVGRLEQWLRGKFVDYPLVYRELGRSRLFSLTRIVFSPFALMFGYMLQSIMSRGISGDPVIIPLVLLTALIAYLDASRMLMSEKSSGSFDLLIQGGLTAKDFIQNCFRLALLRLGPSCLLSITWSCWLYWQTNQVGTRNHDAVADSLGIAFWSFGVTLSLIVAVWCGTALGVRTSMESTQWRSNVGRFFMDLVFLAAATSFVMALESFLAPRLGRHAGLDLLASLVALRWTVTWTSPTWSGSKGDCAPWALLLLPSYPVLVAFNGAAGLYLVQLYPALLVAPWLLWAGSATCQVWNFRDPKHWLRYLLWVVSYLASCTLTGFVLFWIPKFYCPDYLPRGTSGLAVGFEWQVAVGVLSWAAAVGGLMRFSSRTAPLQVATEVGFRRRSAWAACLGLVALSCLGARFYRCAQLAGPLNESESAWLAAVPAEQGQLGGQLPTIRVPDIDVLDLRPWATSDAQVYEPQIRSQQILARQVQKTLDVAFDQNNRLLPQHRGSSSKSFLRTQQSCQNLWKLEDYAGALEELNLLTRLAQLQPLDYWPNWRADLPASRLRTLAIQMVVSGKLSVQQLNQIEAALAPLEDVGADLRSKLDRLVAREWLADQGRGKSILYPNETSGDWAQHLYRTARTRELIQSYLKFRDSSEQDKALLNSIEIEDPIDRSSDAPLRGLRRVVGKQFAARDGLRLALQLERYRLEHGHYPSKLSMSLTPGLRGSYEVGTTSRESLDKNGYRLWIRIVDGYWQGVDSSALEVSRRKGTDWTVRF